MYGLPGMQTYRTGERPTLGPGRRPQRSAGEVIGPRSAARRAASATRARRARATGRCSCASSMPGRRRSCAPGPPRRGFGGATVAEQAVDRLRQRRRVVTGHDDPGVVDGLAAGHVRDDHRGAAHRLQEHERHPPTGRGRRRRRRPVARSGVVHLAPPLDPIGHAERGRERAQLSRSPCALSPPTSRRRTVGSDRARAPGSRGPAPSARSGGPRTRRAARRRRARPWARRGEALAIHPVVDQGDALGVGSTARPSIASASETATIASQRGARTRSTHRYSGASRPPTSHDQ